MKKVDKLLEILGLDIFNRQGLGPGGSCKCSNPECDYESGHELGKPCIYTFCPKCGAKLMRK